MTVLIAAATIVALTACGGGDGPAKAGGTTSTSTATGLAVKGDTNADSTWTAIHAAVPTAAFTVTVTAANDGNHLLGRPNQYTSAMKFSDSRISTSDVDGLDKDDVERGGGVEVFDSHDDAQSRANYIQRVTKALPMFAEYDFVHGRVLVRVSHYLTPDQASDYDRAAADL